MKFRLVLELVEFIAVAILYLCYRNEHKIVENYRGLLSALSKLKTEERPVLDEEKIKYAKEKFRNILSTFLEEFYSKKSKSITQSKKHDLRCEIVPLLPLLLERVPEVELTEDSVEDKVAKLKMDFNAYTEEMDMSDLVCDILDIIL